jgi:hypothetical protein
VITKIIGFISPTLNYQCGDIKKIPIIIDDDSKEEIEKLVNECIIICKNDWDMKETSWNYKRKFNFNCMSVKESYNNWKQQCENNVNNLTRCEERINQLFISIYGLDGEISASDKLFDKLCSSDIIDYIRTLLSYAVGCMFGRYSLDKEGLVFAGGSWNPDNYQRYQVDLDNIIPINDDEYFGDDIVTKFVNFIKIAFGNDDLENNLKYIADNLGVKGSGTSRDKIRTYFLKDFYKDHLQMYQKRPIYWMFDSGKENGFKALIYMHRYEPNLIGKMRQNYLLPMQHRYADQKNREKDQVKRSMFQKKLDEVRDYDLAMELYSSNPVSIDLNDGVKVNYEKFQNIENTGSSKGRIDLLYKI